MILRRAVEGGRWCSATSIDIPTLAPLLLRAGMNSLEVATQLALPPKPVEPTSEDCCQSGCITCVWDLYSQALEQWQEATDASAARINIESGSSQADGYSGATPEISHQPRSSDGLPAAESDRRSNSPQLVSLDAFAELERKLAAQQLQQLQQQEQLEPP